MKRKSLLSKSLTQFAVCMVILMLLASPLFYWLTRNFYAEDMISIIEAVEQGRPVPRIDLEEDIMQGVMIQFVLIGVIVAIAMLVLMRLVSKRLWQPFDATLHSIEGFSLEGGKKPQLPESDIAEFARLNAALDRLIGNSLSSYKAQKEFTENASHELQTPLAVFQVKLDQLLQQPGITEGQAVIIQDLCQMNARLSRLSRNLLLLAKMENGQFGIEGQVDVAAVVGELLPYLESLTGSLRLECDLGSSPMPVKANRSLLESMVSNLVVNAVRHNRQGGVVRLRLGGGKLAVSNTSDEKPLDASRIFNRFYRPAGQRCT